jgi:hypothetical protein
MQKALRVQGFLQIASMRDRLATPVADASEERQDDEDDDEYQ